MLKQLSVCTVLSVVWLAGGASAAEERANVVMFLVDDMGWMDTSAYGSEYYDTPNMLRFARESMRFTDAYAYPLCSPSRTSILTGQHSSRHGITSASGHKEPQKPDESLMSKSGPADQPLLYAESKNYLEPSQYTIAEAMRDAGYRTGFFGKWHLGLTEPHWPDKQGFDVVFHGKPDPGPASYFSPYGFRQYQSFEDGPEGEYITDRLTDEALEFIVANRTEPFFLNLWHYGLHGPWGHKEEYTKALLGRKDPRGQQGNPIMASMLQSIDESLGRVMDELERLGLSEQTVFIFYSDNGGNIHSNIPNGRKPIRGGATEDGKPAWQKWAGDLPPTNNAPLRGGKSDIYEGGIRVPLMVRWPGKIEPGTTSDAIVGAIDMYPTILDLVDLPKPQQQTIDGESFAPVLLGEADRMQRDAYITWFPHQDPAVAIRQGDWKLIRRFVPRPEYPEGFELFNLRDDLSETTNLAAEKPELVAELNAQIDQFIQQTGALVPQPNPAYDPDAKPRKRLSEDDDQLQGFKPRNCDVVLRGEVLSVQGTGRSPFLGRVQLGHEGPVTLRLRARGGSGIARVQWRVEGQESFPSSGQEVEFDLPLSQRFSIARVKVPVEGKLLHMRLYLPLDQAPIDIDWIEAEGADGKKTRWDFQAEEG